ncbi:hypothetical protein PR048_028411 [Dryococelus australis]|uniref:Uncharacterized protein n=1 Tax=Dryococelus australis TaxID=614101 RepID=A0ABQ9GAJ6_9NEOP|nr:hypothetical protein PR048_028411 [Dryococelus australis]
MLQQSSLAESQSDLPFCEAAVAERLECSPSTKANRVQSPVGSFPDFHKWESCRAMPLVGGDIPFSPPLHCGAASFSPYSTLIGSQDLVAKKSLLSTHLPLCLSYVWDTRVPTTPPSRLPTYARHCRNKRESQRTNDQSYQLTKIPSFRIYACPLDRRVFSQVHAFDCSCGVAGSYIRWEIDVLGRVALARARRRLVTQLCIECIRKYERTSVSTGKIGRADIVEEYTKQQNQTDSETSLPTNRRNDIAVFLLD